MASSGSVGTLSWSAKLDSNEFKKGVKKVKKQMKEAQKAVSESIKVISSGFAVATGAIAGVTTALGAMVIKSSRAIKDIEDLAKVADTSFADFIKMSEGAKRFGIQSDKLSDILKDVKDRVGDLVATGGGPMKDFFENIAPKIGLTADAFKNLSGKDSLQLFYNSLEQANLSQAEMTFYLEAMASDLTLLQPLLEDNGALFKKFGDEAERAGLILPDDKVQDLKDSMMGFERLSTQITASVRNISAELAPTFTELTNDITEVLQDSDVELKVLFDSIASYFDNTVDGMRYTLESLGIIDEFYTWQDAFLDTAFFIQNTFNYLMLYMKTSLEKVLSTLSYPFRVFIAGVVKAVQGIFKVIRKAVKLFTNETKELDRAIGELQDAVDAYDVTSLTKAFDGTLTDSIKKEIADSRKEFDKMVSDLERKRKEKREKEKDNKSKIEPSLFGAIFKGVNKATDAIGDALGFMAKPNEYFDEGRKKFNDENGKDDPIEVTQDSNTLATAGSIEEFNLISAQRKEELDIAKKQLKALEKIQKNQPKEAGLNS